MDIGGTLARMFPTGVVSGGNPALGGFFEVRGLPPCTIPENCEVLASGQTRPTAALQRRESFLVKTDDFVIFFHICLAHPDSGYAEFVMGRLCAHADDARARELQAYALMSIKAVYALPAYQTAASTLGTTRKTAVAESCLVL